ncbi:low molecular weight phosphotyrosine protein phosphatase [Tessaracoccus sp. OS52]|uniref:low molecular weight protein-tyrosine-phosphatase n=1 Tax=Tessaracoccus sp. OS52 TaxID=2886691 RepID=UPI001D11AF12|nr:low molecular weight protein-tyrosine-phosphatase [Tessaracoccus sp. OS52]MCC2594080.1 low molecular weight phosphotyrosine protein phosphatase [Tessaracoccus sp. OS52]
MASLVFVCYGNICRSPMAERVARKQAAERGLEVDISSFALSTEELGNPIDRRAVAVLKAAGYDTDGHRARQVTATDIESADLVVAVEPYQLKRLRRIAPGAVNLRLLNDFNPELEPGTPLIDPWYGDDAGFHDTLADVEAAMPGILDEVEALAR